MPRERTKLTSSTTQLGGVAVILPVNVAAADACFFGRAGCQLRAGGPVPMTDIWEAGEVWRSHQMGMRCRCGVLAMIWGTELTPSCQKPTVCVTRHNRGATRAKSARQEPSQGHLPCSCRADYTGLLCSRSLGLQSRRDGARGLGSSLGFQRFGNVENRYGLSGLRIFDTKKYGGTKLGVFFRKTRYIGLDPLLEVQIPKKHVD